MFLTTTSEKTYWKSGENILFLGQLCLVHGDEHIHTSLERELLTHHWVDLEKMNDDYIALNAYYESFLLCVAKHIVSAV